MDTEVREVGMTSLVILTCNQLEYTRECLDSVRAHTNVPYEIIVVDNGSTDGTVPYLREQPDVILIENETNRGFPAAANQGIRAARGEQILLLNNDTIVTDGWLRRMLVHLNATPDVGLVGPCSNNVGGVQRIDVDYTDTANGLQDFARRRAEVYAEQSADAAMLVGFCLLFRKSLVDQIGTLDERFGVGTFEDNDFCHRARTAGFTLRIALDAFVHHFGSRTFAGCGFDLHETMVRNQQLYAQKWSSADPAAATDRRQTLSLCMIVRDSSRTLGACLRSVRDFVDEMIVVDTGSSDDTVQIATDLGARVYHFTWCDDFSAARNESLRHATGDWCLWIDSDDVLGAGCGPRLRAFTSTPHPADVLGYVMQVHCPSKAMQPGDDRCDTTIVDHVKLIRNRPDLRFDGRVHEQILPSIRRAGGQVAWSDLFVVHAGSDTSAEGRRRKHDRDLRILKKELSERPEHPFTLFNLGMTYADMDEPEQAADWLRRAVAAAQPGDSHLRKAYALLAACYVQLGRDQLAEQTCREGLREAPADPELTFRSATLAQRAGRFADAEIKYRQLLATPARRYFASVDADLTGYKARQNLAVLYSDHGRFEEAEAQWRSILRSRPTYRVGWRGLFDALQNQQRLDDAERLADRASHEPSVAPEGLCMKASLALVQGRLDDARQSLKIVASDHPKDADGLRAYAAFLFDNGPLEEAADVLQRLVTLAPDDPSALHNLATVWLRLGQFDMAATQFRASLALRPGYRSSQALLAEAERQAEQAAALADAHTQA